MCDRRPEPADPRQHAVRTLAALLVRHGPHGPEPEPPESADLPEPANEAEPTRKAA
jgi:hypothetical protein